MDTETTLIVPNLAFTHSFPNAASPEEATDAAGQLQADIEFWKGIKNSANQDDFRRYLKEYPDGEFSELAKLRIAALEAAHARAQQVKQLAYREAKLATNKTGANVLRQREAETRGLLEKRLVEIKTIAADDYASADAKRKMEAAERARRAKVLAEMAANRANKVAEILADREAERAAEAEMEAEAKRKLEAEIKRKREAKK